MCLNFPLDVGETIITFFSKIDVFLYLLISHFVRSGEIPFLFSEIKGAFIRILYDHFDKEEVVHSEISHVSSNLIVSDSAFVKLN